jgi:hypothetical protein
MIKIIHKDLDQVAVDYYNKVKDDCNRRLNFFSCLFDVIANGSPTNNILNHSLHGATKKTVTNNYLITGIANQQQYHLVNAANIKPVVLANINQLITLVNYLSIGNNLKKLILVKPDDAAGLDATLQGQFGMAPANEEVFYDTINAIINYGFFDGYAYAIASTLGLSTCPYCNRNFIHTVIDKTHRNILRPTFDHFFSQVDHPFLSLSFYNLVPSCYNCNSNLKGQVKMKLDTHSHPYLEGFDDDATFYVFIKHVHQDKSNPDNYELTMIDNQFPKGKKSRRIFGNNLNEGNVNLFKIKEIYRSHLDVVGELVVKCDQLSISYANSLAGLFSNLRTNQTEFYRFYFGNYLDDKDHHRRPLAKMSKDIIKQVLPAFLK